MKKSPPQKVSPSSQEAALAQLARLKGTLVHLLTYDHDNDDDDEEDYDDDNEDEDKDKDDEDEDDNENETTGAQKGFQGTWSTYPLATCLTP